MPSGRACEEVTLESGSNKTPSGRSTRKHMQVIVVGDRLSLASAKWLEGQWPFIVFHVDLPNPAYDSLRAALEDALRQLHSLGCDLSGQAPTVFHVAGCPAGVPLLWMWHGLTGIQPRPLALVRVGPPQVEDDSQPVDRPLVRALQDADLLAYLDNTNRWVAEGVLSHDPVKNDWGRRLRAELE